MSLNNLDNTTASVSFTPIKNASESGTNGELELDWSFVTNSNSTWIELNVDINVNTSNSTARIDEDYKLYYYVDNNQTGEKKYISDGENITVENTSFNTGANTIQDKLQIYVEPIDDSFYDFENVNVDLSMQATLTRTVRESKNGQYIDVPLTRSKSQTFSTSLALEDNEPTVSISDYTTTIYETPVDFGDAASFDGVDDYVESQPSNFPSTEITLEGWFKRTENQGVGTPLFSYATSDINNNEILLYEDISTNSILIFIGNTSIDTNIEIPDENWHHWAVTWRSSDGQVLLYSDGEQVFSGNVSQGDVLGSGGTLVLGQEQDSVGGGFASDQAYAGQIDEFRIWNTARTQSQIQDNLYQKLDGTENNLVSYYNFDEDSVNGNTVSDITENGNDGTLTNGDGDNFDSSLSFKGYVDIELDNKVANQPGIILNYQIESDSTATQDQDFYNSQTDVSTSDNEPQTDSLFIPQGEDSGRIYLTALPDAFAEGDENINLTLLPDFNKALSFDGSDDYVSIPDSNNIDFSTDENFTVEAWVKADSNQADLQYSDNSIIEKWSGSGGYPFVIRYFHGSGTIRAARYDGSTAAGITSSTTINDSQFHHIAFVKQGETLSLYIDGKFEDSTTDTTTASTQNTSPLYIGNRANRNHFKGEVDEVRIWNSARTETEIQETLYTTLTGDENNLVGYYNFNENSVNGTTINDITTNSNDGTLNGATATDNLTDSFASDPYGALGPSYGVGESKSVTITLQDNDAYSATIALADEYGDELTSSNPVVVDEDGNATFKIKLGNEPTADVTINLSTSQGSLSSSSFTFNTSNWDTYQEANVSGLSSDFTDFNVTATFTSNDTNYNGSQTIIIADSTNNPKLKVTEGGAELELTPTVSIAATKDATEGKETESGVFTVSLDAPAPEGGLDIPFTVSSTATEGTDYNIYPDTSSTYSGGSALSLDGVDDYVEVSANQNPTDAITVEAWAKSDTATWNSYGSLVSKRNAFILHPELNTNSIKFYIHNGSQWHSVIYSPDSSFDITQWHHYAGTYDGTTLSFYVDGQEVNTSKVNAGAINLDSGVLTIGRDDGLDGSDRFFKGEIDEVRIWETARTEAEIQQNLYAKLAGTEDGLVAYYNFDEATATIPDLTGNGNDGTPYIGQSLSLDGSDDYVSIPDSDNIDFGTDEDFTIEAWIKADSNQADLGNGDNDIIEKWSGGGVGYPFVIRYLNASGKIIAARYDGSNTRNNPNITSNTTINDHEFHHVAFIKEGETLSLYIDGNLEGTTTDTTTNSTQNTSPLHIGNRANTNHFAGEVDELRIWNKARTQTEIQENLYNKLEGTEENLVAYYNFENDSGTTITDSTANGNNGTLNNGDGNNLAASNVGYTLTDRELGIDSITIAEGETQGSITVSKIDNDIAETNQETLSVTLGDGENYQLDSNNQSATVNLQDDDEVGIEFAKLTTSDGTVVATSLEYYDNTVVTSEVATVELEVTSDYANNQVGLKVASGADSYTLTAGTQLNFSDGAIVTVDDDTTISTDDAGTSVAVTFTADSTNSAIAIDETSEMERPGADSNSFALRLSSQPTDTVTLNLTIPDAATGEGQFANSTSTEILTFTTENWDTYQEVTLYGVDDTEDDDNVDYSITATASSNDTNYEGITNSISVTNQDNENEVVEVDESQLNSSSITAELNVISSETSEDGTTTAEVQVELSEAAPVGGMIVEYDILAGTANVGEITSGNNPLSTVDFDEWSNPSFADVDGDGDLDAFVSASSYKLVVTSTGIETTVIGSDSNASTTSSNSETSISFFDTTYYKNIGTTDFPEYEVSNNPLNDGDFTFSAPTFADIDNDGNLDAFIGNDEGTLQYYEYSSSTGQFEPDSSVSTSDGTNIDVGNDSSPTLVDIDNDGDFDLFVGSSDSTVYYFENVGDADNPSFEERTGTDNPLSEVEVDSLIGGTVTNSSSPTFGDIDGDGDYDALIGSPTGELDYYLNIGDAQSPVFELQTDETLIFNNINFGLGAKPTLVDIDNDGLTELFVGNGSGKIDFYEINSTGKVYIAQGETAANISFNAVADLIAEDDETIKIKLVDNIDAEVQVTAAYDVDTATIGLQLASDGSANNAEFTLEAGDILNFSDGSTVTVAENTVISTDTTVSVPVLVEYDENNNVLDPTVSATSIQSDYQAGENSTATLTINDDDTAKVLISSLEIDDLSRFREDYYEINSLTTSEDGSTETFYVSLASQPIDYVAVYLGVENSEEGLLSDANESDENLVKLVFSPSDWDTAQQVTLTAVDDDVDDGDTSYNIISTVISEDVKYNEDNVILEIAENFSYATTSTSNTISLLVDDLNILETELTAGTQLKFANGMVVEVDSDATLNNSTSTSVSVTQVQAANQIKADTITYAGNSTELIVAEDYLVDPNSTDNLSLQINDDSVSEITLTAGAQLTFSNGAVVTVNSDVTLSNTAATEVDVTLDSNQIKLDSTLFDSNVTTSFTESISTDLSVTNTDNDIAGIVANTYNTSAAEGYSNNFFSLQLATKPTGEVNVTMNPVDELGGKDYNIELEDEFTGESHTITFNESNWDSPQTIKITAVDDSDVEFDHASYVDFEVSSDDDSIYDALNPSEQVKIHIADNDLPTVGIEAIAGAAEAGAPGYFVITLDQAVPDSFGNTGFVVNYSITSNADIDQTGTTDDLKPISASVRIAPGENRSPIIAFPIDDFSVEDDETLTVELTASENYKLSDASTATLKIVDNDEAGVRIVQVGDTTTVTEGNTSEYYVSLLSQPDNPVYISFNKPADTIRNLSVTQAYDGSTVYLQVNDSDVASLVLPKDTQLTFSNGTVATVNEDTFIESTQEGNAVNVTLSGGSSISVNETTQYSYSEISFDNASPLEFTSDNWYELQAVTVRGIDDGVIEIGDYHTATVTHTVVSQDTNYDNFTVDDQTINIIDRTFDTDNTYQSLSEGFLALQDSLDSLTLPIIGSLNNSTPSFIEDLLDNIVDEVKATEYVTAESLQETFNNAFGTTVSESGLDTNLFTLNAEITNLSQEDIEFLVAIEGEMVESVSLGSDLGLPALGIGIETEGDIDMSFDYGIDLAFGINKNDGFYINTEDTVFEVGAALGLSDDFSATGNLAFLQLDIDNGSTEGTGVDAEFVVTFEDANDSSDDSTQLTLSELNAARKGNLSDLVQYGFSGDAFLDLDVVTSVEGDTGFPSFSFNLSSELPLFNYSNSDDEEEVSGAILTVSGSETSTEGSSISLDVISDATELVQINKGTELTFGDNSVVLTKTAYILSGTTPTKIYGTVADDGDNNQTETVTIASGAEAELVSGDFNISFNDITLDLGGFVTDLMSPIISYVNELIEPFQPIINLLQTEIELLETLSLADTFDEDGNGKATLIEVASTLATTFGSGNLKYQKFFDAVTGIIDLVDTINDLEDTISSGDNLGVDFGDYTLENFKGASDEEEDSASSVDTEASDNSNLNSNTKNQAKTAGSGNLGTKVDNFFSKLDELGISIPLLEDPLTAINLFLGQDIDLVTYDIPELDIEFSIEQEFPIFGSIKGLLEGGFSLYSDLVVGFDTYGLSQWEEENFDLQDSYLILDGFYLSDVDPDTGEDVDELTLDATIAAGVSASAVVAKAEVKGGITGTAALDIIDGGEFTGTSDGKLRGSEVIEADSLLDLFTLTGSLEAFLEAVVKVGIDFGFYEIMETVWDKSLYIPLFEFELGGSSGTVSQSYIEGATVFFDANLNGTLEEGEPVTTSNADGSYNLEIPLLFFDTNDNGKIDPEEGRIVTEGGTDSSSGVAYETPFMAPYGSRMVTPLTTLKQKLIEDGSTSEEAEELIKEALDLPEDIKLEQFDSLAAMSKGDERGTKVYKAHVQMQSLFAQTSEYIKGFGKDELVDEKRPIAEQAIEAIAKGIGKRKGKPPINFSDSTELEELIKEPLEAKFKANPGKRPQRLPESFGILAQTVASGNKEIEEVFKGVPPQDILGKVAPVKQITQDKLPKQLRKLAGGGAKREDVTSLLERVPDAEQFLLKEQSQPGEPPRENDDTIILPKKPTKLAKGKRPRNLLELDGDDLTDTKIKFSLISKNLPEGRIHEIAIFTTEDEEGTINGINPEDANYKQAALNKARSIFSILPDDFIANPKRIMKGFADQNIGFLLIKNGTVDSARRGV